MHDNIKNGLKALVENKRYEAGQVKVWLPQFKRGDGPDQQMRNEV